MNEKLLAIRLLRNNESIDALVEGPDLDKASLTAAIALLIQRTYHTISDEEYEELTNRVKRFISTGKPVHIQAESLTTFE